MDYSKKQSDYRSSTTAEEASSKTTTTTTTTSKSPGMIHLPLYEFPKDDAYLENRYQHLFPVMETHGNDSNHELQQMNINDSSNHNSNNNNNNNNNNNGDNDRSLASLKAHDYGTHFATIYVGNPAQPQVLAVSTDSDYSAFPCTDKSSLSSNENENSNHEEDFSSTFVYSQSTTFRSVICGECYNSEQTCNDLKSTCIVSATYRDMSMWEAFEAVDVAYIGGKPPSITSELKGSNVALDFGFPFMFACQTQVHGWRTDDLADGIMGFSSKQTSIVNQMYQAKVLKRPAFSLCFGQKEHPKDMEVRAGSLTLGGFNPQYHASQMVFAKNTVVKGNSFSVEVRNVFLRVGGGESVKPYIPGMEIIPVEMDTELFNQDGEGGGGGVVIDSSTPFTLFSQHLSEPFHRAWKLATGEEFSYKPISLTEEELRTLPTILIQLTGHPDPAKQALRESGDPNVFFVGEELDPEHPNDILVAFPATRWMDYNVNTQKYRPRVSFENSDGSVLGANLMQGHDVTFDLLRDRIGFAEVVTCVFDGTVDSPNLEDIQDQNGFFYTDDLFNGEMDDEMGLPKDNWGADDAFLNDDIYKTTALQAKAKFINDASACDTMVCKTFVGTGYFFALVSAWVLWKCVNVKAKVSEAFGTAKNIESLEEIDFPDYDPDEDAHSDGDKEMQMKSLSSNIQD